MAQRNRASAKRISPARSWVWTRALLAALSVFTLVAVFGCGGGGGDSSGGVNALLGEWDGTMTVTSSGSGKTQSRALGDVFGLAMQFLQGGSSGSVAGSLIKTLQTTIGGNPANVIKQIGPFTGNLTNNILDIASQAMNLTAHLNVGNGTMNGTFTQGSESGTITLTQKTNSSVPNKNVVGTWVGNSGNQGGITVLGQTSPVDFTLTVGAQNSSNGLTQVAISSPALGGQTFTTSVGGVIGSSVALQGTLPQGLPPVSGFDISGLPYSFAAQVDPNNPNKLTGTLQVNVPGFGFIQAASFVAYRQQQSSGGGNPTIFVADATRVVAMDDITGKNWQTNILSGVTPYSAYDLAIGPNGHLYLADYPRQIEEFDAAGHFVTAYQPSSPPSHVYVDANGKIYWRGDDLTINRMDNMSGANRVSVGGLSSGLFSNPAGIATDTGGYVYVADAIKDQVIRFDPSMAASTAKTFGSQGGGAGQFDMSDPNTFQSPGHAIAIDQQNHIYIADLNNDRIVRFDADALNNPANANVVTLPQEAIRSSSNLIPRPLSVAVDKAASPHVFFTTAETTARGDSPYVNTWLFEASNFSLTGTTLQKIGGTQAPEGGQTGHFHNPLAVAVK